MRVVALDATGTGLDALISRRRELGQDRYDEVREGAYFMVPAPGGPHADVDAQLVALLRPAARRLGLTYTTATNIGEADDYRVPDGAIFDERPAGTYAPTARLVVEVRSPGDDTYDKVPFYAARGVEELLVADPQARTVTLLDLTTGRPRPASRVLGLTTASLTTAVDWP